MSLDKLEFDEDKVNSNLEFDATLHEYKVKGKKLISVSQLIDKYTPHFDSEDVVDRMFESSPSKEIYLGKSRQYIGMTKEQILNQWDTNRIAKSAYGTWVHQQAEDIGNGEDEGISLPELNQVRKFFKNEGYEIVAQELQLYSEELGIAGTVDLLLKKDDKYYIYDWKTNLGCDLEQKEDSFKKYFKSPIDNVPLTKHWSYALQMSVYRYIMETEMRYGLKYQNKFNRSGTEASRPKINFGESAIVQLIGHQGDLKQSDPYKRDFGKKTIYPDMNRITYKIIPTAYMLQEVRAIIKDYNGTN